MDTFRIVKIIDPYTIVINASALNELKVGTIMEIFTPTCEVVDPHTGKSLGTLDFIKGKVKVKSVLEKMTICESAEITRVSALDTALNYNMLEVSNLFGKDVQKKLNIDTAEISGGYANVDEKIKIGDLVRVSSSIN